MTRDIEKNISKFLSDKKARYTVTITGFTEGPRVLSTDKALAAARARNASILVQKRLGKRVASLTTLTRQLVIKSDFNRRIVIKLTQVD